MAMKPTIIEVISYVCSIIDAGFDINDQNAFGQTALHVAVEYRQKEAVGALLARNANRSITDEKGHMTALDIAEFNLSQNRRESNFDDDDDDELVQDDEIVKILRAADVNRI